MADDPECGQSSGWTLQAAAATQDYVRMKGSSVCHILDGGEDISAEEKKTRLGSCRSLAILAVSVGHNQIFVGISAFRQGFGERPSNFKTTLQPRLQRLN